MMSTGMNRLLPMNGMPENSMLRANDSLILAGFFCRYISVMAQMNVASVITVYSTTPEL